MSVLGTIFAVLGVLITPFGIFAWLMGFVSFFMLPIVAAVTPWKKPSQVLFGLASHPIRRAAVVISESNDALFKQMTFDSLGVEKITLDGEEKDFDDPDNALHWWQGMRFALADEENGILFDPRHAIAGHRKQLAERRDEATVDATTEEWESYGVEKWVKGVFEMPEGVYELADLSKVRELVDGGERAEYPRRVEEMYKHSRDPYGDGTSMMKFLYPILGFSIPFFGIWVLASQLGAPNAGGGSTVGFGAGFIGFLLAIPFGDGGGDSDDTDDTDDSPKEGEGRDLGETLLTVAKWVGVLVVFAGIPLALFAAIAVFVSPIAAIGLFLAYAMGLTLLPFLSVLARGSEKLSGFFAELFFKLGFLGYQEPVFVWTPEEYELREQRDLEDTEVHSWYGLFGRRVGFAFEPEPESWGEEVMTHTEVESHQEAIADGGSATGSNVPAKFVRAPELRRDSYAAMVPKRVNDAAYYLHSGMASERFKGSANGEKSYNRLMEAKDKFGTGDEAFSDKTVLYATVLMGLIGIGLGVFFFLL
jgi:hypothetical protein